MTIGLSRWLRGFASAAQFKRVSLFQFRHRRLDHMALSDRDLADLNLPDHVAEGLRARRAAEDLRRSVWR